MPRFRCRACQGQYVDPDARGMRYFHSCAPVHNPAYDAQFTIDANGDRIPKGPLNPNIPEMLERAGRRDENVERKPDGTVGPKTNGAGRDTL